MSLDSVVGEVRRVHVPPPPKHAPPPPRNTPANNAPKSGMLPTHKWGVIQAVDNANTPRFATVLINNDIPPVVCNFSGQWGPFAAGGTSGYKYFYNNSSSKGGSWCVVDIVNKSIIGISGQVSLAAPTPVYSAITNHKHTGGPNSDGLTDPQPVDLGNNQSQNQLPYNQHASAIQGVIDSGGNVLSVPFTNGKMTSAGVLTNVDGQTSINTVITGISTTLVVGGVITAPTSPGLCGFDIGGNLNTSSGNYYRAIWDNTTLRIVRVSAGSGTVIATASCPFLDQNPHTFEVTINYYAGSTTIIQAVIDGGKWQISFCDTSALGVPSAVLIRPFTGGSAGTLGNYYAKNGSVPGSSFLKNAIPNTMSWTTDLFLHTSSSGTSPNITQTFWYDNGTASTAAKIYNPDGSTINCGFTTSTSGNQNLTGVTSGQSLYALLYYVPGTGTVLQVAKSPFSQSTLNNVYADGGYVAINATVQPLSFATGGGTGGGGSGGGGRGSNRY